MPPLPSEVAIHDLRWRCQPDELPFETTAEVDPLTPGIGQEDAIDALRYGLSVRVRDQNVYVRGLVGTGRERIVRRLLREIAPSCPLRHDLCFVHNFRRPDKPRLVRLPQGQGAAFRDRVAELVEYIGGELTETLGASELQAKRHELEKALNKELAELGEPFDEELAKNELQLVNIQLRGESQTAIVPVVDGEPATPERLQALKQEGKLDDTQLDAMREKVSDYGQRFQELSRKMQARREEHRREVEGMFEGEARRLLRFRVGELEAAFQAEAVRTFLGELIEDVIRRGLSQDESSGTPRAYRVNLLLESENGGDCPIIVETTPTVENLVGSIEPRLTPDGLAPADHMMICAGSLLRANGGFLILEARDVLTELGAWKTLMRSLRTGRVQLGQAETPSFGPRHLIKPEAIEIDVKVILIGEPGLYHVLDAGDPDFPNLFKVLSDFETTIPRGEEAVQRYAGMLSLLAREDDLPPFDRTAVAALAEHGARIAGRQDRLSVRFGRLADIAREAAFLLNSEAGERVEARHVLEAVRRGRRRADLPARRFRDEIRRGTIRIQTSGETVGQINGLAVVQSGPLSYGFPARITATIGAGSAGAINIEREAQLSGAIHTKGFYILGGLLRYLLRSPHPHAFSAAIAFEQSYGGIDGDSASGAEMCCLLSALTDVPIRQRYAMTGAIDQHGHIQAIGAATEKIEGFFEVCSAAGLTGDQGVLIPRTNVGDLMLRQDVVDACEAGQFHVFAVDRIQEALEILTGVEAGERDANGAYPPDTLLGKAVAMSTRYWEQASNTCEPKA